MKPKTKILVYGIFALFGAAVIVVLLIRSAQNAKANKVTFLKMVWHELRFIFTFSKWGSFEVGGYAVHS